nr:class I SAM-dependent methyltransferase [Paenibacillus lautus]
MLEHNSDQKLRGAYYTPEKLADIITLWAFGNGEIRNVLEPSCGDGAFLESLLPYSNLFEKCTAIEIESDEAKKAKEKVLKNNKFNVINSDFFNQYLWQLKTEKFDLVIGNPPYIRYQYLSAEQRQIQSDILVKNGMKSNKLINAWVSFVVASVELLSENGKVGLVIPAELLQVAYAEDLRLFLENSLSKITVITFEELVFPDVQQEVVILLGEKGVSPDNKSKISIIEVTDLESLNEEIISIPVEYKEVDHSKDKWTKYFLSNDEISVINYVINDKRFNRFSDVADVDIGITTGNNKYFSVSKEVVENYDLQEVCLPLIGRSAHAHGLYFNREDWQENVNNGLLAQLVYFPNEQKESFPQKHQDYINWGEAEEHNKGYKLGLRKNWFHIPSVYAPDAFFLRRNDTFPKFVLNDISAVSTDTMHRIRFIEGIDRKKALLSYYNSITFAFTEIEGRSYGGGVLEVLPGEVEKIMLPNLQQLDNRTVEYLLTLIDNTIRNGDDIEQLLDIIDREVLVAHLGVREEIIRTFRVIWKKMMTRRRQRK